MRGTFHPLVILFYQCIILSLYLLFYLSFYHCIVLFLSLYHSIFFIVLCMILSLYHSIFCSIIVSFSRCIVLSIIPSVSFYCCFALSLYHSLAISFYHCIILSIIILLYRSIFCQCIILSTILSSYHSIFCHCIIASFSISRGSCGLMVESRTCNPKVVSLSLGPAGTVGGGSECTTLSPPSIPRLRCPWARHRTPNCSPDATA